MRKSAENIDTLCGHFGAITVPRDHRELEVWRKAHKLALDIYSVTKSFPKDELYGLTSQLRRAAVAITTNLAEGAARRSTKEYIQFCYIARGSASEVDSLLLLTKDLRIMPSEDFDRLSFNRDEISRMLTGMIKALQRAKD